MKKKIIVTWVPMSWKSTFATNIAKKYWIAHIPLDPIVTAFQEAFPKTGIGHKWWEDDQQFKKITKNIKKFLFAYINELDEEHKHNWYVLEGFHMPIKAIIKTYKNTHTIIVIWYPNSTIEQKFKETRKYDKTNRTVNIKDNELKKLISNFISRSKKLYNICKKNKIIFVDTSENFKTTIKKYS